MASSGYPGMQHAILGIGGGEVEAAKSAEGKAGSKR